MFGALDDTGPERVLASQAAGRFVTDDDAVYEPGVRLYFDNYRIITDGLAIRDGLHITKVRNLLPLAPYLIDAVGVDDVDPVAGVRAWSLRAFVESADGAVRRRSVRRARGVST